jgi:CheY-like chemotaxis protein
VLLFYLQKYLEFQEFLKEIIDDFDSNWDVDFFANSPDFGKAQIEQYDVIISNFSLPSMNGRELLKSISSKTKAELALMSSKKDWISEEDLNNHSVKTLLDKKDPKSILDWIKYIQSKKKILTLTESQQSGLERILSFI